MYVCVGFVANILYFKSNVFLSTVLKTCCIFWALIKPARPFSKIASPPLIRIRGLTSNSFWPTDRASPFRFDKRT